MTGEPALDKIERCLGHSCDRSRLFRLPALIQPYYSCIGSQHILFFSTPSPPSSLAIWLEQLHSFSSHVTAARAPCLNPGRLINAVVSTHHPGRHMHGGLRKGYRRVFSRLNSFLVSTAPPLQLPLLVPGSSPSPEEPEREHQHDSPTKDHYRLSTSLILHLRFLCFHLRES